MMKLHNQSNKERRKSWLPQSNLLTSIFYPKQHQQRPSNNTTLVNKRRSQSLDQGNTTVTTLESDTYRSITPPAILHKTTSLTNSGTTLQTTTRTKTLCCDNGYTRRHKHNNFVGSLFSKAKKHPQLKRAATLIETTANHYKKSTKENDKLQQDNNTKNNNNDTNKNNTKDDPLLVSLFGIREDDVDRMQQKNDLIRLAFAGEFTRPMNEEMIGKVLDIGCGPLSWSIDFAKSHPKAKVTGLDVIDMIPPDIAMDLPENCQLLIHNCTKEFPFEDNSVDICHVRFMNVSLTMDQYCKMVSHCWRVLKPGGYLELMEMDMLVYSSGPVTEQLNQQVIELVRTLGLKPRLARYLRDVLPKDACLTDDHITEFYRSLPIGVWGGRLGVLFRDDLIYALTHARSLGEHSSLPTINNNDNDDQQQQQQQHIDMDGTDRQYMNDLENNDNNNRIRVDNDSGDERTFVDYNKEDDLFENQLLAAEKELEQCKSFSNFHFIRVQKPL